MTRKVYLPAPPAYEGPDACRVCGGRRLTGEQFVWPINGPTIDEILVDVICPACQGCGRGPRHVGCDPAEHADWTPDEPDDDDHDERDRAACAICGGRGWNTVLGFPNQADPRVTYHLRVPCGCAEAAMVQGGPLDPDDPHFPPLPRPPLWFRLWFALFAVVGIGFLAVIVWAIIAVVGRVTR